MAIINDCQISAQVPFRGDNDVDTIRRARDELHRFPDHCQISYEAKDLVNRVSKTGDRCYDFKNIFAEKIWRKKSAFLPQIKGNFAEKVIITSVFEKHANFFRRKLAKNRRKL
jgi:hypothetical protein